MSGKRERLLAREQSLQARLSSLSTKLADTEEQPQKGRAQQEIDEVARMLQDLALTIAALAQSDKTVDVEEEAPSQVINKKEDLVVNGDEESQIKVDAGGEYTSAKREEMFQLMGDLVELTEAEKKQLSPRAAADADSAPKQSPRSPKKKGRKKGKKKKSPRPSSGAVDPAAATSAPVVGVAGCSPAAKHGAAKRRKKKRRKRKGSQVRQAALRTLDSGQESPTPQEEEEDDEGEEEEVEIDVDSAILSMESLLGLADLEDSAFDAEGDLSDYNYLLGGGDEDDHDDGGGEAKEVGEEYQVVAKPGDSGFPGVPLKTLKLSPRSARRRMASSVFQRGNPEEPKLPHRERVATMLARGSLRSMYEDLIADVDHEHNPEMRTAPVYCLKPGLSYSIAAHQQVKAAEFVRRAVLLYGLPEHVVESNDVCLFVRSLDGAPEAPLRPLPSGTLVYPLLAEDSRVELVLAPSPGAAQEVRDTLGEQGAI